MSYVRYYSRLARQAGLLDRQGRRAAVLPPRGHALRSPRDGLSDLDLRSVAGRRRVPSRLPRDPANTLVDVWRCHELWSLVGELREMPGAILEVGVWRGGTGALWRSAPRGLGLEDTVYLCDTWKGVVKTGEIDTYYRDGKHDDASKEIVDDAGQADGPRPTSSCSRGSSPTTPRSRSPIGTFRLCHCDVDVYESAKDVFDWVWPRLAPGAWWSSTTTGSLPAPA